MNRICVQSRHEKIRTCLHILLPTSGKNFYIWISLPNPLTIKTIWLRSKPIAACSFLIFCIGVADISVQEELQICSICQPNFGKTHLSKSNGGMENEGIDSYFSMKKWLKVSQW